MSTTDFTPIAPASSQSGFFHLLLGDCLERMAEIPDGSVDMVMCDLPYGTTACKWDSMIPFGSLWGAYRRACKRNAAIVLTASQPFTSALVMSNAADFKYCWVWDKGLPTGFQMAAIRPLKQHEDIAVFYAEQATYNPQKVLRDKPRKYNRGPAVVGGETLNHVAHDGKDRVLTHYEPRSVIREVNANNRDKVHPTQKPVALMEYLIRTYTNEARRCWITQWAPARPAWPA
jgi:site-specific DNA-methyltransferase (adenine-specific)